MLARGLYTCIPDVLLGWVLHSPIRHFSLGAVAFLPYLGVILCHESIMDALQRGVVMRVEVDSHLLGS